MAHRADQGGEEGSVPKRIRILYSRPADADLRRPECALVEGTADDGESLVIPCAGGRGVPLEGRPRDRNGAGLAGGDAEAVVRPAARRACHDGTDGAEAEVLRLRSRVAALERDREMVLG